MTTPYNPPPPQYTQAPNAYVPPPPPPVPSAGSGGSNPPGIFAILTQGVGNWIRFGGQTVSGEVKKVNVPGAVPSFLGNRQLIIVAWIAAMIIIGFDEWHNLHILPRPSRLWYASGVYGGLAIVSAVDALVPVANAFAIGFTIVLIYQYYNNSGQFSGKIKGAPSSTTPTSATPSNTTTPAGVKGPSATNNPIPGGAF